MDSCVLRVQRMTKEHLGIVLALRVPAFIVITKIDIAPPQVLDVTLSTLSKLLKVHSRVWGVCVRVCACVCVGVCVCVCACVCVCE